MPNFILNICSQDDDLMLNNAAIECCLVNSAIEISHLQNIVQKMQNVGRIVLLNGEGAAELCVSVKADGIITDLSKSNNIKKDISETRQQIGNGVLGVISRNRRHEAMLVSENEPDFLVFKVWNEGSMQTLELAKWYANFFLLQMAIMPQDDEVDISEYNADMLILTPRQYKIFVAKK